MKLNLILNTTIVFLMMFILARKRLHVFINIFIFMLLEFTITSYFAILSINIKAWELPEQTELILIFYIYEVILLPFIYLWYFNLNEVIQKKWLKAMLIVVLVGVLSLLEYLLVVWEVITYINWHLWQSLLAFIMICIVMKYLQRGFIQILQREGIHD